MIPEHYARDIVERCDSLIESLLPVVMRDSDTRFGGPLGTTFLTAMSTPMINPADHVAFTARTSFSGSSGMAPPSRMMHVCPCLDTIPLSSALSPAPPL